MPDVIERTLTGRSIWITRPEHRAGDLAGRLRARGARVVLQPFIEFAPPVDSAPAAGVVAELPTFDWVVFTSANGVEFFVSLLGASTQPTARPGRIAAIGPATARALGKVGLPCDRVATDSRSEGMIEALSNEELSGRRILIVRPEVSRDVIAGGLRERGATVCDVPFYRTVAHSKAPTHARRLCGDGFRILVLTSPSNLERLLEAGEAIGLDVADRLRERLLIAIGGVTAAALRLHDLPLAAVCVEPSDVGILRAIDETAAA